MRFLFAVLAVLLVWSCGRSADATPLRESIREALFREPVSVYDAGEEGREARLNEVATAIDLASDGKPLRAAVLLAIGRHESAWARYVGEWCEEVPDGAPDCDRGTSLSYWQMKRVTCPKGWATRDVRVFATCADRIFRGAVRRCSGRHPMGDIAGGFSGYWSADCTRGVRDRVASYSAFRIRLIPSK